MVTTPTNRRNPRIPARIVVFTLAFALATLAVTALHAVAPLLG